jgi:phage gpG-like protein
MPPNPMKAALAQAKKFLKKDAIDIIGIEAKKHFQKSFQRDQQGFTDEKLEKWQALKPETVKAKTKKNGSTAPILTRDGHLRDSIDWNSDYNKQQSVLSSHLPYARVHNEGGGPKNIPKRQFMGPSRKLNKTIVQKLEKGLDRIFN